MLLRKPESAFEAATMQQYGFLAPEHRKFTRGLYVEKINELETNLKTCEQYQAQEINSCIESFKELLSKIP